MANDDENGSNGNGSKNGNGHYDPSHESRLQNVEENLTDVKSQQSELAVTVKFLSQHIQESTSRISDKIDQYASQVNEKVKTIEESHDALKDKVSLTRTTLKVFEEDRQKSKARWAFVQKGLYAMLSGAAAIGVKELIVLLIRIKH